MASSQDRDMSGAWLRGSRREMMRSGGTPPRAFRRRASCTQQVTFAP